MRKLGTDADLTLIIWCLKRQLEIDDPEALADIMGITSGLAATLLMEASMRQKPDPKLQPALFDQEWSEDDGA